MWFKNIRAYRLTSPFDLSAEQLGDKLAQRTFEPCAKSQALSLGWVPPVGGESTELVHAAAGRLLVKLKREEKLLPSAIHEVIAVTSIDSLTVALAVLVLLSLLPICVLFVAQVRQVKVARTSQ